MITKDQLDLMQDQIERAESAGFVLTPLKQLITAAREHLLCEEVDKDTEASLKNAEDQIKTLRAKLESVKAELKELRALHVPNFSHLDSGATELLVIVEGYVPSPTGRTLGEAFDAAKKSTPSPSSRPDAEQTQADTQQAGQSEPKR